MLQPVFEGVGNLAVSRAWNDSGWVVATIQAFHLLALALFVGAILVVDLRLLGRGLTEQSVAQVVREARPWVRIGFAGLVVTGIPQLMSLAEKEYYNDYFWLKVYFLVAALTFMLTVRRKVTQRDEAQISPLWSGAVGIVSIALWSGVGVSARLIGLF